MRYLLHKLSSLRLLTLLAVLLGMGGSTAWAVSEGSIFNLAGQKMKRLQKGINIVNGRKFLVK